MKPDSSSTRSRAIRRARLAALGALTVATLVLAGCGGDDSSSVDRKSVV